MQIYCKKGEASKEDSGEQERTYSSQSKEIKHLSTVFPCIPIAIFLLAFIIKPIHLCNLSALMVSPQ